MRYTESTTGMRADKLINESRSNLDFGKIESHSKDPRKKWNAVKEALHPPSNAITCTPQEEVEMALEQLQSASSTQLSKSSLSLTSDSEVYVHRSDKINLSPSHG